ncbi:hypothetical protein [Halobacillus mangrovi]|uniref:Uncharacterized protein n=1 Tax=Halobacillus mangrovi TaxID=402384 RepID=A0A1W5ZQZ6_9BACI|nr:hypothetical protein [Halobacillus mangrovi]ARI75713.1 hypothetical protein HM131_02210 [Halobacillus mangrovi]
MKKVIFLLRRNNRLYLITLFSVFIFLIGSMALTQALPLPGRQMILLWISMMVYLMVFLGVDPILKGVAFSLVPTGTLMFLKEWVEFAPDVIGKWIAADTTRGGPAGFIFFAILLGVIKVSKVEPYIKWLEKQKRKIHRRAEKPEARKS